MTQQARHVRACQDGTNVAFHVLGRRQRPHLASRGGNLGRGQRSNARVIENATVFIKAQDVLRYAAGVPAFQHKFLTRAAAVPMLLVCLLCLHNKISKNSCWYALLNQGICTRSQSHAYGGTPPYVRSHGRCPGLAARAHRLSALLSACSSRSPPPQQLHSRQAAQNIPCLFVCRN